MSRHMASSVIAQELGGPQNSFKKWFASFANIKSFWGIFKVVPGIRKTMKYLRGQFALVRQQPRPGLVTALVEAEQSGDRLSDDELLSMVMLLLLAGHETTVPAPDSRARPTGIARSSRRHRRSRFASRASSSRFVVSPWRLASSSSFLRRL